jgi:hypothetical protein
VVAPAGPAAEAAMPNTNATTPRPDAILRNLPRLSSCARSIIALLLPRPAVDRPGNIERMSRSAR